MQDLNNAYSGADNSANQKVYEEFRNPDYGKGCLRRHILVEAHDDMTVTAALEDDCHAFAIALKHDGEKITDINATWERHTTSTCPGALEQIKSLIGCPLSGNLLSHRRFTDPTQNCTHLFDASGVMITHAWRFTQSRKPIRTLYEITVTDAVEGKSTITLNENGSEKLRWDMEQMIIQSPPRYKGQHPLKGMTSWAVNHLEPQELEYAVMMQKAQFVTVARLYQMNELQGVLATESLHPPGVCYAVQPERVNDCRRVPTKKDFSDTPEEVLKFYTGT